jgi:hypothetical protein
MKLEGVELYGSERAIDVLKARAKPYEKCVQN